MTITMGERFFFSTKFQQKSLCCSAVQFAKNARSNGPYHVRCQFLANCRQIFSFQSVCTHHIDLKGFKRINFGQCVGLSYLYELFMCALVCVCMPACLTARVRLLGIINYVSFNNFSKMQMCLTFYQAQKNQWNPVIMITAHIYTYQQHCGK